MIYKAPTSIKNQDSIVTMYFILFTRYSWRDLEIWVRGQAGLEVIGNSTIR